MLSIIFYICLHAYAVQGGQLLPSNPDVERIGMRSPKRLWGGIDRFVLRSRAACRWLYAAQECRRADGRCEAAILYVEYHDCVERQHAEPRRIGVPQLIGYSSPLRTLSKEWNPA